MPFQLIAQPVAGGDNALLDVGAADATVDSLRALAAARFGAPGASVKLVCEGLELADGATLAEYFIQPLSTVRVVVSSGAPPPAPAAAPEAGGGSSLISPDELARTVVVTGIPDADAAATDAALHAAFSRFGAIDRLLFNSTGAGKQHAVLVFGREHSAAAALGASGAAVLGEPVSVVLASNLNVEGGAPARGRPSPSAAADAVAGLLAKGTLFGVAGVAHARRFDEANGLSTRVRVVAEGAAAGVKSLDAKYAVSSSVAAAYDAARAQALELDARVGFTGRVTETAEKAKDAAKAALAGAGAAAARVAADPRVSAGVAGVKGVFGALSAAVTAATAPALAHASSLAAPALAQASADLKHIQSTVKSAVAPPEAHLPPGQAPRADAGGAADAGADAAAAGVANMSMADMLAPAPAPAEAAGTTHLI